MNILNLLPRISYTGNRKDRYKLMKTNKFAKLSAACAALLAAGFIIYMVLHEATHAIVMKAVGAKKVIFGFTGMYAFAGSKEDYFDKSSYRLIALAPVVVWGIIFAILTFVVPADYYWVLWLLQVANISGAAGNLYVTFRFWNFPPSILVMDTGIDMTVYDK